MRALGRLAAGLMGPEASQAPGRATRCAVFDVRRGEGAQAPSEAAVVRWLHALDTPVQATLLADRLAPEDIRPLGRCGAATPAGGDLTDLSVRLAREGLVRRRLTLTMVDHAQESHLAALAEAGLALAPLDVDAVAALTRRLLVSLPMADVLRGADVAPGSSGATADAIPERLRGGERSLGRLSLPDHVRIHPGYVEGDAGSAVLLYIDALPRELDADALAGALRAPEPVDLSVRLWPLPGDEVIRYLTRRLRDLRSTQATAGNAAADFRLSTAVEDAERLREALYLGQTRLLQIAIVLCVRGTDAPEALAAASRVRARLARAGFLPRLAVLRQWPALASMLPGAPDRLGAAHNVTSQAAARLLPFALCEGRGDGILFGRDEDDHVAVHLDRTRLANPAAVYLGAPGSGKSAIAKMEILRRWRVAPADRFLIVDPEGEYRGVVSSIPGGHELDVAHPDDLRLPLLPALGATGAMRAARATTLLAPLLGASAEGSRRRLAHALDGMLASGTEDLSALPAALQTVDPALAEGAERALAGPLAVLAGRTGPGPRVRALSLRLSEVDTAALPALLPVLTEAALGHLHAAPVAGSGWLWLTLDEFHLYLERESGARLMVELAKRARKRGIVITAVTQHLVDLLRHPDGQAILAACETVALFRPGVDVAPFAEALRLDAPGRARAGALAPGHALLRVGGRLRQVRVALSPAEEVLADTRPTGARPAASDGERGGEANGPAR